MGDAGVRPARSILFALWDGEEQGLLGSQYWASDPTIPLSQIKLAINLDMVGRLENGPLEILGTRSMPGLRRLVAEANFSDELPLQFPWKLEDNSDHHSFFIRQVPVLMFHTGLHNDYHRPSDDVERVDFRGLEVVTRLIFNSLVALSSDQQLGPFRAEAGYEGEARQREFERPLPPVPPRLGISWHPNQENDAVGVTVLQVRPGSAAARAGLRSRDRIVSVNGQALEDTKMLQQWALMGEELRLGLVADGGNTSEPQERRVRLDGNPVRLGISWRYSSAEPASVMLVRVVPHSPAHQAGLRAGDRVYSLNGTPFDDSASFNALAQQLDLPAAVRIERHGRLLELTLPAPLPDWQVAQAETASAGE
jgi:hypothetical protein